MKILTLVSAIDLIEPLGGTIFWWQLLKALSDLGVEIVVVPFIGKSIKSPWWECYPNPALYTSKLAHLTVKKFNQKKKIKRFVNISKKIDFDLSIGKIIQKKWMKQFDYILKKEHPIDAVMILTLPIRPMNDFFNVLKKEYGLKLIYIEADMPEVLSQYNTLGYDYYSGIDLSIFDGFLSNSEGVSKTLKQMGAKNVGVLDFAVDPKIYRPYQSEKRVDVLFSGAYSSGRENMIKNMIFDPAHQSNLRFGLSGMWIDKIPNKVHNFGFVPFHEWLQLICGSNINLNISRRGHANVYGTSTYRLFELCSLGCSVVTNKLKGIEKWYVPGKEVIVLSENEDPLKVYNYLLSDKENLAEIGILARERTLKNHTCLHRAKQLMNYVISIP